MENEAGISKSSFYQVSCVFSDCGIIFDHLIGQIYYCWMVSVIVGLAYLVYHVMCSNCRAYDNGDIFRPMDRPITFYTLLVRKFSNRKTSVQTNFNPYHKH